MLLPIYEIEANLGQIGIEHSPLLKPHGSGKLLPNRTGAQYTYFGFN